MSVLYAVARIEGRPFGVRAYWEARNKSTPANNTFKNKDVVDVEMREIP
jgi:hypothetical protein